MQGEWCRHSVMFLCLEVKLISSSVLLYNVKQIVEERNGSDKSKIF